MTAATATLAGLTVTSALVHVPAGGPWFADVELEGDDVVEGRATLVLGTLELEGTVLAAHDGTHVLQRRLRMVAGAGGWGTLVPARGYHNDAQIRARTPAEDIARAAGEQLGDDFSPGEQTIGIDYVRQAGPASRALEDVIGGASWWVDFGGVTRVGARSSAAAAPGSYEVLQFDPRTRVALLAVDRLADVGVGSVLAERLDAPQTVRELAIEWTAEAARVRAWCGGSSTSRDRVVDALRALVARLTDGALYGPRLYRVGELVGDRVKLQPVDRSSGLPMIGPISLWPGMAGLHAELALGAHVLVEFVDGDRTQPIVTHFAGKDGTGWTPTSLVLDASGPSASLKLGANATKPPAWAEKVLIELGKLQTTLESVTGGSGSPVEFVVPYTAPVAVSDLGAAKTVCE